MPGSQTVPAGSYRVLLQNAGGDTAEESFTLSSRQVQAADAAYPSATVTGGTIRAGGPYDTVDVWAYGKDGRYVGSFPVSRKGPPLEAQSMAVTFPSLAQGFSFRVFANNSRGGYGVVSGPYTVGALTPAPATLPGK